MTSLISHNTCGTCDKPVCGGCGHCHPCSGAGPDMCAEPCLTCGTLSGPLLYQEIARNDDDVAEGWRCLRHLVCEGCGANAPSQDADQLWWTRHSPWLCDDCWSNESERAHERMTEDYYGGSSPTLRERLRDAHRQHKR